MRFDDTFHEVTVRYAKLTISKTHLPAPVVPLLPQFRARRRRTCNTSVVCRSICLCATDTWPVHALVVGFALACADARSAGVIHSIVAQSDADLVTSPNLHKFRFQHARTGAVLQLSVSLLPPCGCSR
jgi:hypothetical protein